MAAFCYDLLNLIPLLFAGTLGSAFFLGTAPHAILYLLPVLFGVIGALLHGQSRKVRALSCGILLAALLGVLLTGGRELLTALAGEYFWLLVALLSAAAGLVAGFLAERFLWLKLLLSCGGAVWLFAALFLKMELPKCLTLMILFYIVAALVELVELRWKKEGDTDRRRHMVFLSPVLLSVFLLLFLFRAPEKPYDWSILRSLAEAVRVRYELFAEAVDLKKGWDSDEAFVGFSGKGEIGGSLSKKPYPVLTVSSSSSISGRLYLGARTYDTFAGGRWSKRDEETLPYRALDTLETLSAVYGADEENAADYIRKTPLTVSYVGLRANRVFTPPKNPGGISGGETREVGGDLTFLGKTGSTYRLSFYRLNRENTELSELLSGDVEIGKKQMEQAAETLGESEPEALMGQLPAYHEAVYRYYGEAPEISARTREYLDEVLAGAESDYEKLVRIERLLSGFSYSESPGALPERAYTPGGFLDYLLFEKQEGYCTHFATAFVLLARAEGIPARYVEGYAVTGVSGEKVVRSDMAHTWPEAYLPGFGWLSFEPTPGYLSAGGWNTKMPSSGRREQEAAEKAPENTESEERDSFKDTGRQRNTRVFLIPLALAAGFAAGFLLAELIRRRLLYRQMSCREKVIVLSERKIRRLRRKGFRKRDEETLREFARRAGETLPPEDLSFLTIYERALYSGEEIGEEEVRELEE